MTAMRGRSTTSCAPEDRISLIRPTSCFFECAYCELAIPCGAGVPFILGEAREGTKEGEKGESDMMARSNLCNCDLTGSEGRAARVSEAKHQIAYIALGIHASCVRW